MTVGNPVPLCGQGFSRKSLEFTMADQLEEQLDDEQTLSDMPFGETAFTFPVWLRFTAVVTLVLLFTLSVVFFVVYLFWPQKAFEPSKIGVGNLTIFSFLGIIVFLIPWEDYGLRIRKFGPFEFEQILRTQAQEHIEELNDLRIRISQLEESGQPAESRIEETQASTEFSNAKLVAVERSRRLRKRLLEFLTSHDRWAFSPARIAVWGSRQREFKDLKEYNTVEIRRMLQAMVADGELETRISKRGNTLYRVPR